APRVMGPEGPTHTYRAMGAEKLKVLLNHPRLTDDVAFRFSDRSWDQWPLTAEKLADWVAGLDRSVSHQPRPALCNLLMNYETFGQYHWAPTGVFDFLHALPAAVLGRGGAFMTVSQAAREGAQAAEPCDATHMVSWADPERDLS